MKELNTTEIEHVSGGDLITGLGITMGFFGSINGFASFGRGLGAGIYDSIHRR